MCDCVFLFCLTVTELLKSKTCGRVKFWLLRDMVSGTSFTVLSDYRIMYIVVCNRRISLHMCLSLTLPTVRRIQPHVDFDLLKSSSEIMSFDNRIISHYSLRGDRKKFFSPCHVPTYAVLSSR